MIELLLDVALIDLGRAREACAQRMPGEFHLTVHFRQIPPDSGGKGGPLDQPRDFLGVEAVRDRGSGSQAWQ